MYPIDRIQKLEKGGIEMSFLKDRPTWMAPWARMWWWILGFGALCGLGHRLFTVLSAETFVKTTGLLKDVTKDVAYALICVLGLLVLAIIHIFRPYEEKGPE